MCVRYKQRVYKEAEKVRQTFCKTSEKYNLSQLILCAVFNYVFTGIESIYNF